MAECMKSYRSGLCMLFAVAICLFCTTTKSNAANNAQIISEDTRKGLEEASASLARSLSNSPNEPVQEPIQDSSSWAGPLTSGAAILAAVASCGSDSSDGSESSNDDESGDDESSECVRETRENIVRCRAYTGTCGDTGCDTDADCDGAPRCEYKIELHKWSPGTYYCDKRDPSVVTRNYDLLIENACD